MNNICNPSCLQILNELTFTRSKPAKAEYEYSQGSILLAGLKITPRQKVNTTIIQFTFSVQRNFWTCHSIGNWLDCEIGCPRADGFVSFLRSCFSSFPSICAVFLRADPFGRMSLLGTVSWTCSLWRTDSSVDSADSGGKSHRTAVAVGRGTRSAQIVEDG